MRELNYHHLHYFWAVAREGNLTRAAEKLRVSQSSVSVQLKKLEDSLGHELFDRVGRGLELTDAGRVTFEYAESIFATGDELLGVLDEKTAGRERVLRIGVLATLSRNFQVRFLGRVLNRDDVVLKIHSGAVKDMLQRLEEHQLDVVLSNFVPSRTESSTWVAHTIAEQPVSLIGQWTPVEDDRSLEELLESEPLVVPTVESSIRLGFDSLVERLGVRPRIVAEIDDMAMMRLVTRSHEGLAVIPPIVVQDELSSGRLVERKQLPGLAESFLAVTTPRRFPNPVIQELLQTE